MDLTTEEGFVAQGEKSAGPRRVDGDHPPGSPSASKELGDILGRRVIHGLDAVRAGAVTLVLIDHYFLFRMGPDGPWHTGPMGVMIFFVLSGFLITSMLLREFRKTGSISLREFYRRRAYRIFPSFYVCWLLTSLIDVLVHRFQWKPALASFFYSMDYVRAFATNESMMTQSVWISWSLAIEEKFYLLWPLLLLLLLRKKPAKVARILSFIILGQWIYRAILCLWFHVSYNYFYNAFDMRIDALLIGCLVALLLAKEKARSRCSLVLRSPWLAVVPALALLAILDARPSTSPMSLFLWMAQPLFISVLLVQFIYWGEKSWSFCRMRIVRFVAQISYALYLYHPLAGQITYDLHFHHLGYPSALLALMLAVAAYYCVERPFMRMRDKDHNSPSGPVPVAQAAS